jgi:hypothetical protein
MKVISAMKRLPGTANNKDRQILPGSFRGLSEDARSLPDMMRNLGTTPKYFAESSTAPAAERRFSCESYELFIFSSRLLHVSTVLAGLFAAASAIARVNSTVNNRQDCGNRESMNGHTEIASALAAAAAGVTTFAATNVDDLLLLTVFFARRVSLRLANDGPISRLLAYCGHQPDRILGRACHFTPLVPISRSAAAGNRSETLASSTQEWNTTAEKLQCALNRGNHFHQRRRQRRNLRAILCR